MLEHGEEVTGKQDDFSFELSDKSSAPLTFNK